MAVNTVNSGSLVKTQKGLVKITSVSFTAAASVSIDGCFTSSFTHYIVKRNLLCSVDQASISMRLRVSGVDDASANYRYQYFNYSSTSPSAARGTGQTAFLASLGSGETGAFGYVETWISNPYEAVRTTCWTDLGSVATGNMLIQVNVEAHDLAQSYTGVTAYPSSGTMSGSISVYGLVRS